ncbi:hypothetical protein C4577_05175 [Candidatus Parcubacteria bacterium]|nr:MAG: hypothetical protein C4577_05175 [Candidatus Parcubacteria bacterium]
MRDFLLLLLVLIVCFSAFYITFGLWIGMYWWSSITNGNVKLMFNKLWVIPWLGITWLYYYNKDLPE